MECHLLCSCSPQPVHAPPCLAASQITAMGGQRAARAAASTICTQQRSRLAWAASTTWISRAPDCTSTPRLWGWRRWGMGAPPHCPVNLPALLCTLDPIPPGGAASRWRPPLPTCPPVQELGQTALGNPHSVTPSSMRASREVEGVRRQLMALFGADPAEYEVRRCAPSAWVLHWFPAAGPSAVQLFLPVAASLLSATCLCPPRSWCSHAAPRARCSSLARCSPGAAAASMHTCAATTRACWVRRCSAVVAEAWMGWPVAALLRRGAFA